MSDIYAENHQNDPSPETWTLQHAIEIAGLGTPARTYPGGGEMWVGSNSGPADAVFTDWGLARAVAIILNAVRDGRFILKEDADLNLRAAEMDAAIRESKVY